MDVEEGVDEDDYLRKEVSCSKTNLRHKVKLFWSSEPKKLKRFCKIG